jgi:hypothetical protein
MFNAVFSYRAFISIRGAAEFKTFCDPAAREFWSGSCDRASNSGMLVIEHLDTVEQLILETHSALRVLSRSR